MQRRIPVMLYALFATTVALFIPPTVNAANVNYPNEHLIRMSGTIVRVHMERPETHGEPFVFTVLEVLRGDTHPAGSTFQLPNQYGGDSFLMNLRPGPEGMIGFFKKNWESEEYPVIRFLYEPSRVAAVRKLVVPLSISSEIGRLEAVYALYQAEPSNEEMAVAFGAEFRKLRNPDSYMRALEMIEGASPRLQLGTLEQIGRIGDLRAVPMLIRFLDSEEEYVGQYSSGRIDASAARALTRYFPGAPGVTQAMHDHLSTPSVEIHAARYLNRREPSPKLQAIVNRSESSQTPWGKWIRGRRAAIEDGDGEAMRRLCVPVIENNEGTPMYRCVAYLDVYPYLGETEKRSMEAVLVPVTEDERYGDLPSFFMSGSRAKLLSKSNLPRAQELLIQLFVRNDFSTRHDRVVATMTLRDGPPELRESALAATLLEIERYIEAANETHSRVVNEAGYLVMNLAWLGDKAAFEKGLARLETLNWPRYIEAMRIMEPMEIGAQEGPLLLAQLERMLEDESLKQWSFRRPWVDRLVYRLGQLGYDPVVPFLFQVLEGDRFSLYAQEALLSMENREIADLLESRFRSATDEWYLQRYGELLWKLKGSEMLPTLRELAVDDSSPMQTWAWFKLREIGTPADLELLRLYCDYWLPEGETKGIAAMLVSAELRDRHNYDLNGLIAPSQ